MHGAESLEPDEISCIESQQTPDVMNVHRCGDSSIVDLHASDLVGDEQIPPTLVSSAAVRQQFEITLDHMGELSRFRHREAEAVAIKRPG